MVRRRELLGLQGRVALIWRWERTWLWGWKRRETQGRRVASDLLTKRFPSGVTKRFPSGEMREGTEGMVYMARVEAGRRREGLGSTVICEVLRR